MNYNRINVDGKSVTETRVVAAAILPGTMVVIDGTDKFAQVAANATPGRMYIMNPAYHEGLTAADAVPVGTSGVADYVENDREFAARVAAPITVKKDTPLTVGAAGKLKIATEGTDVVVAYAQEDLVLAGGAPDNLLRVRVQRIAATPAP